MHDRSGGTWRRRLARSAAAGSLASLVLAGVGAGIPAGAQDAPAVVPDVFRASASSQVLAAFVDRDALLPVDDAFRIIALDGTGTYESSNQTARASLLYPGNGVVSGPGLACGTFGGQAPEQFAPIIDACLAYDYPLSVFADSLQPDGSTVGSLQLGADGDPVSARAVRAVAHAAAEATTTDAAMTDLRVLGFPAAGRVPVPGAPELDPTLVTVEAARSATDQRIDEAGHLVVTSRSVLEGIRLVGGLIEIDALRSTSTVRDDGRGGQEHAADLDIGGVTVGGVPAEITDEGLVVGSPTGADGPLRQQMAGQLADLLRELGVQVTALEVTSGVDETGEAFARAGGVLVELEADVRGLPVAPGPQGDVDPNGTYVGTLLLGGAGARGIAATIEDVPFEPGGAPALGDVAPVGSSGTPGPGPSGGGSAPLARATADGPEPEVAAPRPIDAGSTVVRVSELLGAGRVELVYLAFTLMGLAVCLGPRLVLPARFPGAAP